MYMRLRSLARSRVVLNRIHSSSKFRARNSLLSTHAEQMQLDLAPLYWTLSEIIFFSQDLDLNILSPSHRIAASELPALLSSSHLLVDVRSAPEFAMCRIDGAVNYPIDSLRGNLLEKLIEKICGSDDQVTFICRRGNDSQLAVKLVLDALPDAARRARIRDVVGGLHAWSKHVDTQFPVY